MQITTYNLHRLNVPLARPIGDSQVRFTHHWITVLELSTDSGLCGVGFELQQGTPTTGLERPKEHFEFFNWSGLPYSVKTSSCFAKISAWNSEGRSGLFHSRLLPGIVAIVERGPRVLPTTHLPNECVGL